jgi:uncharacterized protein YbjT (DUF2867 family)
MIFLTGATGNIGSEVVRQLVSGGHRVRVLARDPAKLAHLGAEVDVVQGDLTSPSSFAHAFSGVERAFLLAHAHDLPAVSASFAAAAKAGGVRHVVLVSSATILIEPKTTIGGWHLAAEENVKASGLAWTMLRPGNFASNALRWAGTIRTQGAVYAPNGDAKTAPIDPRDIASVAVKTLTTPGHEGATHVLTGPTVLTPKEQVDVIGAAIGKALRFVDVPDAAARAGMLKSGMSESLADAVLELLRPSRSGAESIVTASVREVTGVEARTFGAWARDHAGAFA